MYERPYKLTTWPALLSTALVSQRSWVWIRFRPESISGFNFTTASSAPVIKKITSLYLQILRVFAQHLTGKILSFDFYPKAVYFACKFWISPSGITCIQNWLTGPQRVVSRETWHQRLTSLKHLHVNAASSTAFLKKVLQQNRMRQYRKVLWVMGFMVLDWGFRCFSNIEGNSANKSINGKLFLPIKPIGQPLSKQLYMQSMFLKVWMPKTPVLQNLIILFSNSNSSIDTWLQIPFCMRLHLKMMIFCKEETDTLLHRFWQCRVNSLFWGTFFQRLQSCSLIQKENHLVMTTALRLKPDS